MIKLVFCLRRQPHLSREEFQRYWRECHAPLVEISNRFFREPLEIKNGEAMVPDRPGLGVDIDREALARVAQLA